MKKFSRMFSVVLGVFAFAILTGCGVKKDYKEYVGNQFAGKDPWGNGLTMTVRTIEDNKMTYTFTVLYGEGEESKTAYKELSGELKDDAVAFEFKGETTEDKNTTFDYSGTITLKDGKLVVKYEKGQLTINSAEGGSGSQMAEALDDKAKTVTLEKVILDK